MHFLSPVVQQSAHEHFVQPDLLLSHQRHLIRDLCSHPGLQQSLHHAAEGDQVVAVALSLHLVEELLSEVEVSTLVGGVDECVVRKVVGLGLVLLAHCLVDQLALLQLAVEVEHLENGGVEDGVHADALVVHHPLLGLSSTSEVLVLDACFQQSALGEFVHFDLEFGHVDVEDLEALVEFSFLPLGLDQDTECHLVRLHLRVEHQLLDFHSFIQSC